MSLHGEPALPTPNITNVKKVLAGPGWGGEQNPYVVQNDPAVSFF